MLCAKSLRIVPAAAFGRIRIAHDFPVLHDRILALERLNHHRPGDHVGDEIVVERPFFVHRVETLSLLAAQMQHFRRDDLQPRLFEASIDLPDQILFDAVGLNDRKRPFDSHNSSRC